MSDKSGAIQYRGGDGPHVGIRDRGFPKPTDEGSTFLVTENKNKEDGPAFITLNNNSTLKGVVIYYPEQSPSEETNAYLR